MSLLAHHGIAERKERWRSFLDMEQPPQHLFVVAYEPETLERPWPWPDRKAERIAWAWESYKQQIARLEWLPDDSIPYLDPYTGTEIFAEALGCQVHRPEDNMPFAQPMIHEPWEAAMVRVPDWSATPLALCFGIADELRRRAGANALVKLVDIQSPMDIVAQMWEKRSLYAAIIDEPNAVKDLAAKVCELLTAFLDGWFERYGTECIAHYPAYYMPRGLTLSEDEIGAVSEEMFAEFCLPGLSSLSQRYGGLGLHCCAHARHQWEGLKQIPNLRLLNLVQPPEVLRDAYVFFADHVAQMHSWCGDGPPETWPEQLPAAARVVLQATAKGRREAVELAEKLWAACGRH